MENTLVVYSEALKRVSSPKNEKSVINYSHSCRSKHSRPLLIFKNTKIFLIKFKS